MVNHFPGNPVLGILLIIQALCAALGPSSGLASRQTNIQYSTVMKVFDGDTVEIQGGQRVRYLGIDTPEKGQPLYEEAKNKNQELVMGKMVRLEICAAESRDKHGRLLAYVSIDKTMANRELLKNGYARTLNIPPCGMEKAEEFRRYQKEAMEKGVGLWGKRRRVITKDFIPASDAGRFIDERKAIYGKVMDVQKGRKAIFLHIGNAAGIGLKVVIFDQDTKNFEDDRINPLTHYQNKDVVVYGKIKIYKGMPEVIIGSPSQIEVW